MSTQLVQFEIDLLRHLNGEEVPGLAWGAAMGAGIEYLHESGYVTRKRAARGLVYEINDKGRAAINATQDRAPGAVTDQPCPI